MVRRKVKDKTENVETKESPRDLPEYTHAFVKTATGQTIRVYDLATHGETFEQLAKQMQSQHKGSVIELR